MESYLGEIRLFPLTWSPDGWLPCDGRSMNIQQNQALYSLIGTQFGGKIHDPASTAPWRHSLRASPALLAIVSACGVSKLIPCLSG